MTGQETTVIGKISYTNSWPVYHGFDCASLGFPARMLSEVPSELNRGMQEGTIHIGALSSFAYAEASDRLLLLPDLSVSAEGPVGSILLFTRGPLESAPLNTVAVTRTSATSVNLLKILMHYALGRSPAYRTAEPDLTAMMASADACLLIGDHAIRADWDRSGFTVTDLGQLWKDFTGCSMTFAVWAVSRSAAASRPERLAAVSDAFRTSKRRNLEDLSGVVQAACAAVGGVADYWYSYFRHLCYDFGERQQEGLNLYFRYAHELGLLPKRVKMELWRDNLLTRVKE
ncbi:menaquinone biosynthesis protein [Paenibacillus spiritus]|uniref:Chorismate dehydratase n=1 Tax=Paenibacillus spiritus TaxID=2496557 RepID=A0A5J5GDX1_9BACL|nr:menaquinone biosynthesis protein [Paenibacillus spiritus]KAA9006237.1 menaquinone biosynthesis protein [Paenibacillus spiritus]